MYSCTNIKSNGSGEHLKAKSFSHWLWYLYRSSSRPTQSQDLGDKSANCYNQPGPPAPPGLPPPRNGLPCPEQRSVCPFKVTRRPWPWGLSRHVPLAGSDVRLQGLMVQEGRVTATGKFSRCWLIPAFWPGIKEKERKIIFAHLWSHSKLCHKLYVPSSNLFVWLRARITSKLCELSAWKVK